MPHLIIGAVKKIFDSVHGFIELDPLESRLLDTLPLQRLRYVHQLGIAYLVYPGATHKRFEHSLGTMCIASSIFDHTIAPTLSQDERIFLRRIVRMAALCHDLGHLPYSHVAERVLLKGQSHEAMSDKLIRSEFLEPIWKELGEGAAELISKLARGPYHCDESFTPLETILSECITADFFGADRIDYLLRDAKSTGLPYGSFDYHQLIEMMHLFGEEETLKLGVDINGVESCEALLLARYFMHKRVYQYPSVKAYNYHLTEFMKAAYKEAPKEILSYLIFTDSTVQTDLTQAIGDPHSPHHKLALPLFDRSSRFTAISAPSSFTLEKAKHLKKKLSLTDETFGFERTTSPKAPFNFPVLCRDGTVCAAREVSSVDVPLPFQNWIYIPRNAEQEARNILNQHI